MQSCETTFLVCCKLMLSSTNIFFLHLRKKLLSFKLPFSDRSAQGRQVMT